MAQTNAESRRKYRAKHLARLREEDRINAAARYKKDSTRQRVAASKSAAKRRQKEPDVVRGIMRRNMAAWRKTGSEKVKVANHKNTAARRARIKGSNVPLTPQEHQRITAIYVQARTLSNITGEQYHVDHIFPLALGGKHHPDNLQVLTARENMRKGARVTLIHE